MCRDPLEVCRARCCICRCCWYAATCSFMAVVSAVVIISWRSLLRSQLVLRLPQQRRLELRLLQPFFLTFAFDRLATPRSFLLWRLTLPALGLVATNFATLASTSPSASRHRGHRERCSLADRRRLPDLGSRQTLRPPGQGRGTRQRQATQRKSSSGSQSTGWETTWTYGGDQAATHLFASFAWAKLMAAVKSSLMTCIHRVPPSRNTHNCKVRSTRVARRAF